MFMDFIALDGILLDPDAPALPGEEALPAEDALAMNAALRRAYDVASGVTLADAPVAKRVEAVRDALTPVIQRLLSEHHALPASYRMRAMYALAWAALLENRPMWGRMLLSAALEDAESLGDVRAQIIVHTYMAEALYDAVGYMFARGQYLRARALLTELPTSESEREIEHVYRAQLLARLARQSNGVGDYQLAMRWGLSALRYFRRAPRTRDVLFQRASVHWTLGVVRRSLNRLLYGQLKPLESALSSFGRVQLLYAEIHLDEERPYAVARLYIQIAETYCDIAEYWTGYWARPGDAALRPVAAPVYDAEKRDIALRHASAALAKARRLLRQQRANELKDKWAPLLMEIARVRIARIRMPGEQLGVTLDALERKAIVVDDPIIIANVKTLRGEWFADRGEHGKALAEFQRAITSLTAANLKGEMTRALWGRDRSLAYADATPG